MSAQSAPDAGEGGQVHCWEDGPRKDEGAPTKDEPWGSLGVGSTCMLPDGHDGPHEFEWDDEIVLTFVGGPS